MPKTCSALYHFELITRYHHLLVLLDTTRWTKYLRVASINGKVTYATGELANEGVGTSSTIIQIQRGISWKHSKGKATALECGVCNIL